MMPCVGTLREHTFKKTTSVSLLKLATQKRGTESAVDGGEVVRTWVPRLTLNICG